jgi:hypothetical protein
MFDLRESAIQTPMGLTLLLLLLLKDRTGLIAGIAGRIFFTFFFGQLYSPSSGTVSPGTKTSSPFSFTVQTGLKPSLHEKIKDDLGISHDVLNNVNASTSKLILTKTINPAADELIHPV